MLTRNKIQFIKSLHEKSGRYEAGLFLVEGRKGIMEFLESDFEIFEGYFTEKFNFPVGVDFPYEIISQNDLGRISSLTSNEFGLLVVKMKRHLHTKVNSDGLTLILDGINDPGNLGTIIRIADWYGISRIIASLDTVDCYNPKVIMATMGSFIRVHVDYQDLEEYLGSITPFVKGDKGDLIPGQNPQSLRSSSPAPLQRSSQKPIYGAYLDGENIRTKKFTPSGGYLVIGSESHGIRSNLEEYITDKITIPRVGQAESLNAGVATAVILERMIGA